MLVVLVSVVDSGGNVSSLWGPLSLRWWNNGDEPRAE